jgi:hypothetical protein
MLIPIILSRISTQQAAKLEEAPTMLSTTVSEQLAIQAAKAKDWSAAISHNQAILHENPQDVQAFIRLGVAQAQLGKTNLAKQAFTQALSFDKSNQLAKKHLEKLKNHLQISLSNLPADEQFIEEPGKTKTVELHRLAGKEQLEKLSLGQSCELKSKNRYISVEANQKYVGSLPEDLSSRLTKLMKGGNTYTCYISSVTPHSCSVFLKEAVRAAEFEFVNSFPLARNQMNSISDMYLDDDVALDLIENIPPQIVSSDEDDHQAIESIPRMEENMEETPLPDDNDEN